MKKLFLLVVLLLPILVYAETCDNNKIVISDITKVDSNGYGEEANSPLINNQSVLTNLKLYEVGDSVTYNFKVKNNSQDDYDLSKSINSDGFSDYEIISEDNIIKAGEEKTISLRITYKNKVDDNLFIGSKYVQYNELDIILDDYLINPNTGLSKLIIILFIGLVIIFGLFEFFKDKKYLNLLVLLFIPLFVDASCQYKISIISNIEYKKILPNPCTYNGELRPGVQFESGQYTYTYKMEFAFDEEFVDFNLYNIDKDGWSVLLTDKDSTDTVTTPLCSSINNKPIVSMSFMFFGSRTSSIDFSSFDTSNVVNMKGMFADSRTTTLDLNEFDTSKVTNMEWMFTGSRATELYLDTFDTSNVTDMGHMFEGSYAREIDTSTFTSDRLVNANQMFAGVRSSSIDLRNFDLSNVSNLEEFINGINIRMLRFMNRDNVDLFFEHNYFCQAIPVYIGDDSEPLDFDFPVAIC